VPLPTTRFKDARGTAYGAVLSAALAVALALFAARERQTAVLASVGIGTAGGPLAWNAILKFTEANQFFVDAPIPLFPVSWQDTGSAVFAVAVTGPILGLGPLAGGPGARIAGHSLLGAVAALLVDVYLY
jgi:hypothetical protein